MKEIPLTQGKVAIVDDEDFELVSQYKWHAAKNRNTFYARNEKEVSLHRLIMNAPDGIEVDHKDGDGLNCTRKNMRLATHTQNMSNRRIQKNNTSGYVGVSFHKPSGSWQAMIRINGGRKYLGHFKDKVLAAYAYDKAAKIHHGEFARLNFE